MVKVVFLVLIQSQTIDNICAAFLIELYFLDFENIENHYYVIWKSFQKCKVQRTISLKMLNPEDIWDSYETKEIFIKRVIQKTGMTRIEIKSKKRRKKTLNSLIFNKSQISEKLKLLIEVEFTRKEILIKWYRSLIHDLSNETSKKPIVSNPNLSNCPFEKQIIESIGYFNNEVPNEILVLEKQLETIIYDYNANHLMRKIFETKDFELFKSVMKEEGQNYALNAMEFKPYIRMIKEYPKFVRFSTFVIKDDYF